MGQINLYKYAESELTPEPPKYLFLQAMDLSAEGKIVSLFPIRNTWYLLREPTLRELKTFRTAIQTNGRLATNWIVERCLVEPKELPLLAIGARMILRDHLLEMFEAKPDELKAIIEYSRTLPISVFESIAEFSEILNLKNYENEPCSKIVVDLAKIERISKMRQGLDTGSELKINIPEGSSTYYGEDPPEMSREAEPKEQYDAADDLPVDNRKLTTLKMDDPVFGETEIDLGKKLNERLKNPKLPNVDLEMDLQVMLGGKGRAK